MPGVTTGDARASVSRGETVLRDDANGLRASVG